MNENSVYNLNVRDVEREELEVDVLLVGAGPATLSCAIHLSKLLAEKGIEDKMILVLDKAEEIGHHTLSGAVMNPIAIAELMPDWKEKGFPIEKEVTYDEASFGISGLETALGALLTLVHRGELDLALLVERLTLGPAKILGEEYRHLATLRQGTTADIVLFDPQQEWVVRSAEFASKGKNTPLEGVTLRGRVMATLVGGRLVYSALPDGQQAPEGSA